MNTLLDAAALAAKSIAEAEQMSGDIPNALVNLTQRVEQLESALPQVLQLMNDAKTVGSDVANAVPPEFVARVEAFFATHFPGFSKPADASTGAK